MTRNGSDWPAPARWFAALGALLGLLTVAMGALAAHLPERMLAPGGRDMLRSAVQMQGWHALALLAVGLLVERRDGILLRLAGAAFLLGILLFCLGVYVLAFRALGATAIGHAAPWGGSLLMIGWALLAAACLRRPRTP